MFYYGRKIALAKIINLPKGKKRKIIAEYIRNNLEKRYVLVKVIRKRVSRLV